MSRQPVPRRPMTDDEKAMALALGRCSFVPATQAKRFAAEISGRAANPHPQISDGELGYLRSCVYTFRRQIAPSIVSMAGDVLGDRAARKVAADVPVAHRTSIDPEMDDDATGTPRPSTPRDPNVFDLFADVHPENIPDEPREPVESIPTDDEGREAKTVDRRSFLVALIASVGAWFFPKRAVAQPVADAVPYIGVPYSAARIALRHEQELALRNGLMLKDAWRRKFAVEVELAELRLAEARGEYVSLSSIGQEASRR